MSLLLMMFLVVFIISNPTLVIEQCKAGVVGSFPALNARPKEVLEEWLKRITGELGEYKAKHPDRKVAPFAVNQIVHGSNDRLIDRKSTRLNSSHIPLSRMPSSA